MDWFLYDMDFRHERVKLLTVFYPFKYSINVTRESQKAEKKKNKAFQ